MLIRENLNINPIVKTKDAIGKWENMSNEEYHANSAISRSAIITFIDSPYKYWAQYLNPDRPAKAVTAAMEFGSAFHTFILEPEKFCDQYITELELEASPIRVLLKNVGRSAYDAYKAEKAKIDLINDRNKEEFDEKAEGKTILTIEETNQLMSMAAALCKHSEAKELIQNGEYEKSFIWKDQASNLFVKARPDILHDNIIVDLKTCDSATFKSYQSAMCKHGYHIQGAMIQEGVKKLTGKDIRNVINVCIEKSYPYSVAIKIISEEALEAGRKKFKSVLMEMRSAFENNHFPSYEPETVDLPAWYC